MAVLVNSVRTYEGAVGYQVALHSYGQLQGLLILCVAIHSSLPSINLSDQADLGVTTTTVFH